jgi:hypothetical protein
MVKKLAFITLTVSDLAAAPSHSLHRTLAALPGPGSAHHVALSSPRRRRSPGARRVGSCWLRLEVALPGRITRSCAWQGSIMIAIACASGAAVGFAVLASVTAAPQPNAAGAPPADPPTP